MEEVVSDSYRPPFPCPLFGTPRTCVCLGYERDAVRAEHVAKDVIVCNDAIMNNKKVVSFVGRLWMAVFSAWWTVCGPSRMCNADVFLKNFVLHQTDSAQRRQLK